MTATPTDASTHNPPEIDDEGGTPQIYTLTLVSTATEYEFVFPKGTSIYNIQSRTADECSIGDAAGEIDAGRYWTLKAGASPYEHSLRINSKSLFFKGSVNNQVLEFFLWR